MRLIDQEFTMYRDGGSNIAHISASLTTDKNRLIKYADEYGLELNIYDDYFDLAVDLNEFSIRYNKKGVSIHKRRKLSDEEKQRLAKQLHG